MDQYPSQPPLENPDGKTPNVMIVGAGIAGLMLGILLDRMGVPFQIFERSSAVKPLGAVMTLNANILPVFEQLGLYDELLEFSYPTAKFHIHKSSTSSVKSVAVLQIEDEAETFGYKFRIFSRPRLYKLLLSKVPAERLHFRKKILSFLQNKDGVMIRCNDGTTYHGDILVGADGAYSGVRQSLYKTMSSAGTLPESDTKTLSKGFMCMVGTTDRLDPSKYDILKENEAVLHQVIGTGTQFSWSACNVPDSRICWNVVAQLATVSKAEDEKFRNSEWGPEHNDSMIKEVRDFLMPIGGTLGDLIDATPKELISRVFLEDKIFETWYSGRTVLIGDACHKLLPSAGQGAVNAMQDAVVLANCIYDLKSLSANHITEMFADYRGQRYEYVKEQYDASKQNAKVIYGQTAMERMMRSLVLNYLPKSLQLRNLVKNLAYRPQANFLPQVPKRGKAYVRGQKPSRRQPSDSDKSSSSISTSPSITTSSIS